MNRHSKINMATVIMATLWGYGYDAAGERVPFEITHKLKLKSCDPSRHNTRRLDQVERDRKTRRKANRLKFKRYRKAS